MPTERSQCDRVWHYGVPWRGARVDRKLPIPLGVLARPDVLSFRCSAMTTERSRARSAGTSGALERQAEQTDLAGSLAAAEQAECAG
jgi:hypothetical protein